MVDPIHPFDPHLDPALRLQQSRLFRTTMALTAAAAPQEAAKPTSAFSLSSHEITSLFRRLKQRGITYETLSNFPLSTLSQAQRDFIRYLRRNPQMFDRLSGLDRKPGISIEDLKIASQLAGNQLTLTEEDLAFLETPVRRTSSSASKNEPVRYTAQELSGVLNKLQPQGLRFEDLKSLQPAPGQLTEHEADILHFLQSRQVQKILYNLSLPHGGLLRPEVLRILTSMLWNPNIYGAMPVVFLKGPTLDPDEEIPAAPVGKVERVNPEGKNRIHAYDGRMQIELHAQEMIALLNKLSPGDGHVSLSQLRHYTPENQEEARAINTLKQAKVFRALAAWDHDAETLSAEDIKMAMHEGAMMLYDAHLMLVIVP